MDGSDRKRLGREGSRLKKEAAGREEGRPAQSRAEGAAGARHPSGHCVPSPDSLHAASEVLREDAFFFVLRGLGQAGEAV